jgi:xanthine dehydrogenase accessory factor
VIEAHRKLDELLGEGRPVALATLVETRGSTPRSAGARMVVAGPGESWLSVGGGPFEARVIELCLEALADGRPRLERFEFRPEQEGGFGAVCGGEATVFIEAFRPRESLLVVGAGHCGAALARMAAQVGFRVLVADDREEMLAAERFPEGVRLVAAGSDFAGLPPVDERTYVAIISRDHAADLVALRRLIRSGAAYLGMIGSKRKRREVFELLAGEGVSRSELERVHCPIGLPIGAETPEEIAVSVLAEVIARRRRPGKGDRREPPPGT